MRLIGIDFGTRRVGIAISDEGQTLAFPLKVLFNNTELLKRVEEICVEHDTEGVVIGYSKNFAQQDNPIMTDVKKFKAELEKFLTVPVHYEPELMTTKEATHIQGEHEQIDASAAAIILQSYLDRHNRR